MRSSMPATSRQAWLRCALVAAALPLFSSCGGGGGGESGGGGNGDAYTVSPTSISFTATQGGVTPPAQTVTVTVLRGTVVIATSQSGANFGHTVAFPNTTTAVITVTPFPPTAIPAGTYTGTITVRGCSGVPCVPGLDVAGSPKAINVTYTISSGAPGPTLTSNPSALYFASSPGVNPADKTLDLSLSSGTAAWTSSINYPGGGLAW